jgi:hypothetical protein
MTTTDQPSTPNRNSPGEETAVEHLERLLGEWRGKIDELLVQADLGSKDVSEDVHKRAPRRTPTWPPGPNSAGSRRTPAPTSGRSGPTWNS